MVPNEEGLDQYIAEAVSAEAQIVGVVLGLAFTVADYMGIVAPLSFMVSNLAEAKS